MRFSTVGLLMAASLVLLFAGYAEAQKHKPPPTLVKDESNQIDHGPSRGVYKPKNSIAYHHMHNGLGRQGEQRWRTLSKADKKRYLKKLNKYKMKLRKHAALKGKDASDDVRLQHLDHGDERQDATAAAAAVSTTTNHYNSKQLLRKQEKMKKLGKKEHRDRHHYYYKKNKYNKKYNKAKKATSNLLKRRP